MTDRPAQQANTRFWRAVDRPFQDLKPVSLSDQRQLRLLVLNAGATIGFGVFLVGWHAFFGDWGAVALLLGFDAFLVLNLLALRWHRRWAVAGLLASLTSLAVLVAETQLLGGFLSPATDFLLLMPMIATLIAGYRAGLVLTALTGAGFALIWGLSPPVDPPAATASLLLRLFGLSMFSFMAWMTTIDERSLRRLIAATRQHHTRALAESSARSPGQARRSGSPLRLLSASVAHEMNNPLAAARLNLDRARDGGPDAEARLADALYALQSVSQLVEQLRGHTRLARGEGEAVDVHSCIDAAVGIVSNELRHRAELQVTLMASAPRVSGTAADWTQAFLHLLTNAARAIPLGQASDHAVTVTTRDVPEGIRIEVDDDGVGIPPEILPRVFDPFFTTRAIGEGAGLGLYTVQNVVEHADGLISIAPGPSGVGTRVAIVVPPYRMGDA